MKYRIVKLRNGDYQVQEKFSFFTGWDATWCYSEDYPDNVFPWTTSPNKKYCDARTFPTLELAKIKIDSEVTKIKSRQVAKIEQRLRIKNMKVMKVIKVKK